MATSNLITRTLGSTNLQSGNGSPDHVSGIGSIYTNASNGTVYVNTTGTSTGWEQLMKQAFGELYLVDNTTQITFSANTWTTTNVGNASGTMAWTLGETSGITQTATSSLVIGANRDGRYLVVASGTLQYVATAGSFDIGISKNTPTAPESGFYASTYISINNQNETVSVVGYVDLNANDTLSMQVRCTATVTAILRHGSLTVTKIF